ncbi:NAD(+) diphosphatase [Magnetospirillum sulfuroxidans]|uniref:NAD(+) diphosphatase n=1 Tax=Magnetospirillum sulfuroxidans TaxID=611300 RepID=A0ABS5IET7_9PROT|nr:NAD(+) diphosphatase [Magnetospirillum sulfuroxidans]MBR9972243.1 NAD(+) diphosphatase [Magnetospirillum sulfuroxidans]
MSHLLFATAPLDRAHHLRRDLTIINRLRSGPEVRVVSYWRDLSLLRDGRALLACGTEAAQLLDLASETIFLGLLAGKPVFAADVNTLRAEADGAPPQWENGASWGELRAIGATLSAEDGAILATGRALVNWHRTAKFCGRCGSPTESREGGHVRVCLDIACNAQHYPRTDNAVIMQVTDGDNILLHRQPSWPAGMWSVLAGFVEPGETLEQAVIRETHEETGIIVDDIRYAGSQPWPFPASLMVGFTARAIGGQLCPDLHELEDARWFSRADIAADFSDAHRNTDAGPYLARPGSIARQMIDAWLKG